jgi:hypothetical protein
MPPFSATSDRPVRYAIKDNSTVAAQPVTVTEVESGTALIGKGLKAEDKVVVSGQTDLSPGIKVMVKQGSPGEMDTREPEIGPEASAAPGSTPPLPASAGSTRDEHVGALHPAADRDGAAVGGAAHRRYHWLQPAAGGGAAECRFSDDQRRREPAGASPEVMAHRSHNAGAPILPICRGSIRSPRPAYRARPASPWCSISRATSMALLPMSRPRSTLREGCCQNSCPTLRPTKRSIRRISRCSSWV